NARREPQLEARAAERRPRHAKPAGVQLRDRAREREPESVTLPLLAGQAREAIEHALAIGLRDARARVVDGDRDAAVAPRGADLDAAARRRVAERVVEQVGDDAIEQHAIALHRYVFAIGRDL